MRSTMFHHGKLTPPGLLALAGLLLLLASGCGESNDPAVDGGQAGTDAKTVKDLAADMAKDRTADKASPTPSSARPAPASAPSAARPMTGAAAP